MTSTPIVYAQYDFDKMSHKEQIGVLDMYYSNNSLYESTRLLKYYLGVWSEDIRPLRTPVQRSVEFYVSKIVIGEPKISAKSKNTALVQSIGDIMDWSNFQVQKPLHVRKMSLHGDLFRKVVSEGNKVWHEAIQTECVTSYTEDTRGFLTSIRIDTPVESDGMERTRTEYWTVLEGVPYMAVWEHVMDESTPLDQLGDPQMFSPLRNFGIDFVPFVRSSFRNSGGAWGDSCVQHALLKVDEANRMATRLHQNLFRYNKPIWHISANYMNTDGSPGKVQKIKAATDVDKRDVEVRDNTILYSDGVTKIESLIPNIDYKGALDIVLSQEKELEKDLPELLFYSLPDHADMSGDAIRNLLGAAVDRANQAQSNFVEGTVRLNQMAISIGQYQGIFPTALGTFDRGELAHSLGFDEPFPQNSTEKATTLQTYVNALGSTNLKLAMKLAGFSEEVISEVKIPEPIVPNPNDTESNPTSDSRNNLREA